MQYLPEIAAVAATLLHLAVILAVVTAERRQPTATLAWLLSVIFLPFLGAALYLVIGATRARRRVKRARVDSTRIQEWADRHGVHEKLGRASGGEQESRTGALVGLGRKLSGAPASFGNRVEVLINGTATYRSMIDAIVMAERHVHVEFYIIQPDGTGESLREALVEKARQGVEVRVLYDSVGSSRLPRTFWKPLHDAGGRTEAFNPVSWPWIYLRRRDRVDFRNHRKIVVVDGRVGFTGGINIGREYLGLDPGTGPWRDTHMRVEGPAVLSLQEVFARDWLSATESAPDDASWFPEPSDLPGECLVQMIDSGPDSVWSPVAQIHVQAMATAFVRIWLTTPYFIPSQVIQNALISAALRGVDVRLLLPERADSWVVSQASHTYYKPLLEAGVRIFHYRRGFVHAKTMVVDSWVGTIGSANMDMRSFLLNFELNGFVFDRNFSDELARQFLVDLGSAGEITLDQVKSFGPGRRIVGQTARLLSPLL